MRKKILILLFASTCADFLESLLAKTCPDEDIAARCEGQCELEYVDCIQACSDTNCHLECARTLNDCVNDCPCNINCPDGCTDCPNPICVCGETPSPQNEDNLQRCMKEKSIDLGHCIIDCSDDQLCEQSCVNLFKVQYDQCPCQNDCPLGCPCDSFDCQPDKKSVLVLNTESSKNEPQLIKFDGGTQENFDFTMGPDTSARSSCSATLNGEMFVFGGNGSSQNKQISKIIDCKLKRIGELPNEFSFGACGTFLFDGHERVMFCFAESGKNKCFSYNGEKYSNHPDSVNEHYCTSLGNIGNKVLAVASAIPYHDKVELFDIESNIWTTKTSFPFGSTLYYYGVVSRKSSVLFIGGYYDCCPGVRSSLISRYTIDKWEEVGNLQVRRGGLRAIANGDRIYVVGGVGDMSKTEIWSLDGNDDYINIQIAEPNLKNYRYYPELFLVDSDFCTKK